MDSNSPEMEQRTVPAFGYELLRYEVLPDLLGEENQEILYWAGRRLARRHPCETADEIVTFFHQAGWGDLKIIGQNKTEIQLELTPDTLQPRRLKRKDTKDVALETGFLAEQYQHIQKFSSEAFSTLKKGKDNVIHLIVRWDTKDKIE